MTWRGWVGAIAMMLLVILTYRRNMAFVALNQAVAQHGFRDELSQIALPGRSLSSSDHRWLALTYGLQGQPSQAAQEWLPAGYTFADLLTKGRQAVQQGHFKDGLWWYSMAESLQPNDEELWIVVGQSCRILLESGGICDRFWQHNQGNWLVDSSFAFGLLYWPNLEVGDDFYEVGPCPPGRSGQCAHLVSQQRASLYQCFRVIPGRAYRFTAWLKVEVSQEAFWRPVYYQGKINDQDFGYWPGDQHQSLAWQLWEQAFTAPTFDHDLACFHPIRLQGVSQAWVSEPRLIQEN